MTGSAFWRVCVIKYWPSLPTLFLLLCSYGMCYVLILASGVNTLLVTRAFVHSTN